VNNCDIKVSQKKNKVNKNNNLIFIFWVDRVFKYMIVLLVYEIED